jgi:hypothetical protein
MEVTVQIPDQFVEQLIPAGKDASRLLLEELVDGAYGDGRIDADQANEILGVKAKVEKEIPAQSQEATAHSVDGDSTAEPSNRWANNPEQARLHAIADKLIGCINSPDLPQSTGASRAVQDILIERYRRSQRGR